VTVACGSAQPRRDVCTALLPQLQDSSRGIGRFGCNLDDALQEEGEPLFPRAVPQLRRGPYVRFEGAE